MFRCFLPPDAPAPFPAAEVHCPDGDGRYLLQGKVLLTTVSQVLEAAKQHCNPREHTVLSDVPAYYKEGLNNESVAPDVYVTRWHAMKRKSTCKLWVEGRPPDFAVEAVSASSTRKELEGDKREPYERIGTSACGKSLSNGGPAILWHLDVGLIGSGVSRDWIRPQSQFRS